MPALTAASIGERQRTQVCSATLDCLQRAERLFNLGHKPIPVRFDLSGRAAGMYRVARREAVIRYNPYIFARYFEHGLQVTVPHEVAHYITDRLYGIAHVRPHGREWRAVMQALGAQPRASARFDLSGIPQRRHRRFGYACDCDTHQLSTCRHNRIVAGKARYYCRGCGAELVALA
ncbi:MAG: SprT-like domain-containing protein [Thiogranum sp.]